jgi:hypothetical protein
MWASILLSPSLFRFLGACLEVIAVVFGHQYLLAVGKAIYQCGGQHLCFLLTPARGLAGANVPNRVILRPKIPSVALESIAD